MSESSYEKCHASHRGYMSDEIDIAHEIMKKYKKLCPDSIKELRHKTDMPMDECCNMLRCLWRDDKLKNVQTENAKLHELVQYILDECYGDEWFCEKAEELGFKANY